MALKRARTRIELEKEASSPEELEGLVAEYTRKGLYIPTWSREDLGIELERCGIEGSPTKVHKVESIVLSREGHQQIPPTSEGIGNLLDSLIEEHFFG